MIQGLRKRSRSRLSQSLAEETPPCERRVAGVLNSASQPGLCCKCFMCQSIRLILTQVCEGGANVIPTSQTGKLKPRGSDSRSRRAQAAGRTAHVKARHTGLGAGASASPRRQPSAGRGRLQASAACRAPSQHPPQRPAGAATCRALRPLPKRPQL